MPSPRTTQEYLADIGLVDANALQDVPSRAIAAIAPAAVEENNDKSPTMQQKELLSRIIDSTKHSASPHKQIADARLSPPATARLDVRELLQGRANGLPMLVEDLEQPAMLLEGQDALLLPRERDQILDGSKALQNLPYKHNINSVVEQVKPEREAELDEPEMKTIDECLSLKLSATKKVLEASKGLVTAMENAPGDDLNMVDEKLETFPRAATPPLLARPPRFPIVALDAGHSEEEAIKTLLHEHVQEPSTEHAFCTPIVPLSQFDKWQNHQRLSLSPVSPPSAAQAFPSVMSSGQAEPGDHMHIDIPLMERQSRKRRPSFTDDANMKDLIDRAHKKARRDMDELSDANTVPFLAQLSIPESSQVISTLQRESLGGDPLEVMRVSTPVLSSPHMHPSSEEDLIKTPEAYSDAISRIKPHNDLTLLNITLPNANQMLADIDPNSFEDIAMDESPSCAGVTPERMAAFQKAVYDDEEDEIDELISSQSQQSDIKSFSQQTEPEIHPRMPIIPESEESASAVAVKMQQEPPVTKQVPNQPESTKLLPIEHAGAPPTRAKPKGDTPLLRNAKVPAESSGPGYEPPEPLTKPATSSKPVSAKGVNHIQGTPRAVKTGQSVSKPTAILQVMTTPSQPIPSNRKSRALALLDPQSSRSQAKGEQSNPDSSPSSTPVFRKPFHSQAYIELPAHWPQSQIASYSQDSIIPSQPTPSQVTPMQSQTQYQANLPDINSLAWERQRKQPSSSRRPSLQPNAISGADKMHEYLALRGRTDLVKPKKSPKPVPAPSPIESGPAMQAAQDVQMITSTAGTGLMNAPLPLDASAPGLADFTSSSSPEICNLPNLYCFASDRLLQNVLVQTALAKLNIKINYAHRVEEDLEYLRRRLTETRDGAFETIIEVPDLILAPRAACIFFKLSLLGLRCNICYSSTDIQSGSYNHLIEEAISAIAGRFDHVYLILEAFESPNPVTGEPAPDPMNTRIKYALQTLKQSIAAKLRAPSSQARNSKVEVLLAVSALELARIVRSKINGQYACDPMIADFNALPEAFADFPMSLLTAHTIIQELGSLENFCHLTPFQRKQRYEELIGAEKLNYTETLIKLNPEYRQAGSGFSEYSDMWAPSAGQNQAVYGAPGYYDLQPREEDEYDDMLEDGMAPEDWLALDA